MKRIAILLLLLVAACGQSTSPTIASSSATGELAGLNIEVHETPG